jgi:uncharacterized protein YodC (DUF2158 family)
MLMKRCHGVVAAAALLAAMVAATDALAAGQGGGGQGFGGGRIGGGFGAGGFNAVSGGQILQSETIARGGQSRSTPTISPYALFPPSVGTLQARQHQSVQTNAIQQGSSQSYSYGISRNYPRADESSQGSYTYAGGASRNVALNDDQKARLNSSVTPQRDGTSQHAQLLSNDTGTDLKVGTRVRLRSGGPMMAVTSTHGSDVTCVWFNFAGQAESGTFPAASLM